MIKQTDKEKVWFWLMLASKPLTLLDLARELEDVKNIYLVVKELLKDGIVMYIAKEGIRYYYDPLNNWVRKQIEG